KRDRHFVRDRWNGTHGSIDSSGSHGSARLCAAGEDRRIRRASSFRQEMKRAVVLLSGGLDSATTLAIAKEEGYEVFALSFRYGQRHEIDIRSAEKVAKSYDVWEHRVIEIDLRGFGGSALTDAIDVPKNRSADELASGIPVTYVPARNTIFLSYA